MLWKKGVHRGNWNGRAVLNYFHTYSMSELASAIPNELNPAVPLDVALLATKQSGLRVHCRTCLK